MDQNNNRSPVKKPELSRKKRKPLMEKRRRARINASLEQLKKLVLDATRRDSARYSKLEKADILELTVRHLRDVQRNNINYAIHQDPSVLTKFGDGFGECVNEVTRYLSTIDGISTEAHKRLMEHLSACVHKVHSVSAGSPRLPSDFPPGLPPPQHNVGSAFPFVLNQQGVPMFQHNLPVGLVSPPPTPTATTIRGLPGHSAHISPPISPVLHERMMNSSHQHHGATSPVVHERMMNSTHKHHITPPVSPVVHECMINSNKLISESQQPRSVYIQPQSPRNIPHPSQSMPVRHFGDKVTCHDRIIVKPEPKKNFIKVENGGILLHEHARFIESVHLLRDDVWRPW